MERLTQKSTIFDGIIFRGNGCTVEELKHRLFEYEEAEEQGLLLRLPCSVGAEVFVLTKTACDSKTCIHAWDDVPCDRCECAILHVEKEEFDLWVLENYGKNIFLTKEEAEAALKEMEK